MVGYRKWLQEAAAPWPPQLSGIGFRFDQWREDDHERERGKAQFDDSWHYMVYRLTTLGVLTYSEMLEMPPADLIRLLYYVDEKENEKAAAQAKANAEAQKR